jgi:hypothetical protein
MRSLDQAGVRGLRGLQRQGAEVALPIENKIGRVSGQKIRRTLCRNLDCSTYGRFG